MGDTVREQQMAPGAVRMRRLRRTSALRALVRETPLAVADFIHPLFITAGSAFEKPIETMPGHSQRSVDRLDAEIDALVAGVLDDDGRLAETRELAAVPVFGIPGWCAENARESYYDDRSYFRPAPLRQTRRR